MFRGSMKLLALITEPDALAQAPRNCKYLTTNGAIVPLISGISGEFADDDIRIQQVAMQVVLNLCSVPSIRSRLLVFGTDLLHLVR